MCKMTWHKRFLEILNENGWSIAELSRRSGISIDNLHKYKKGEVDQPRAPIPKKLADALGVNTEWLFFGSGEKFNNIEQGSTSNYIMLDNKHIATPIITPKVLISYTTGSILYSDILQKADKFLTYRGSDFSNIMASYKVNNQHNEPELTVGDMLTLDLEKEPDLGKYGVAVLESFPEPLIGKLVIKVKNQKQCRHIQFNSDAVEDICLDDVNCLSFYRVSSITKFQY